MNKIAWFLIVVFSLAGCNNLGTPNNTVVIYGNDDRVDYYSIMSEEVKENADAVASSWFSWEIKDNRDGTSSLETIPFKEGYNLAPGEPFSDQPIGAHCTAFLVAPDVMVTAGHCINKENIFKIRFVFGYKKIDRRTIRTTIENENIYKPTKIIAWKLNSKGADYAIVKLDRPVKGIEPLELSSQDVKMGDYVYIIGYPVGLPLKYAPNAEVKGSWSSKYFTASLDSYGGNSGSPVFNEKHEVVGILVRGESDFEFDYIGRRRSRQGNWGESVTKVSQWKEFIEK
jgi:hypothetical protein